MRAVFWLVGLFAAAVALALFAGDNEGTVTLFWPPHRVDLSVNLVLLLLVALFALLHFALRGLSAVLALPRQARRWRALQRERAAHALLLDALTQYQAGRFLRARKAAENALARAQALPEAGESGSASTHAVALKALIHLTAADSAHALQDQATREAHWQQALQAAAAAGAAPELREGLLLRAARWALHDRDAPAALARLQELPGGAARRTAALRVKLKAARLADRSAEALDTARLLAKHGAFSPDAARSLLRQLAADLMARTHDPEQLQAVWQALDPAERASPELALRAAQRLLALDGDAAVARQWLEPVWTHMLSQPDTVDAAQRARLARVLESALLGRPGDVADAQWLARVEAARQAHPRDATLQYLAGMACLHRGLWGKAAQHLTQAARTLDDEALRRSAWRALAQLAEQRGDDAAAQQAWRQAAG
ncbi:MAG: heme biosynthesis HemY N-terminal domain-containing protein [Pseudomonadota bacterium]|nr:heme biosynthesis HemY N-terminal domain-containing protein [Pseudomonadota bacterium]